MEIKKLVGGKAIRVSPDRIQLPLYGDKPGIRAGSPGTISGNTAMGVQLSEAAKLKFGLGQPTKVEVIIREIDGVVYLIISPAKEDAKDVYPLAFARKAAGAPVIRKLKPLFEEAGIDLRRDVWYEMSTEVVNDEEAGYSVAGAWTKAVTVPRVRRPGVRSEPEEEEETEDAIDEEGKA